MSSNLLGDPQLYEKDVVDNKERLRTNTISINSLVPGKWDLMTASYPSDIIEVYTYTLASALVIAITVTYVDDTKERILSVSK